MNGCLITADGSEDSLIKPEGLDNYSVPPPSIINHTSEQPTGNHADVQPAELDPDAVDLDIKSVQMTASLAPMRMKGKEISLTLLLTFVIFSTNTHIFALIYLFAFVLMHMFFFAFDRAKK